MESYQVILKLRKERKRIYKEIHSREHGWLDEYDLEFIDNVISFLENPNKKLELPE